MEQFLEGLLYNALIVSGLIPAIIILRFIFRNIPKRILCFLWIIVAIRLLLPVNIESQFGIIPSTTKVDLDTSSGKIDVYKNVKKELSVNENGVSEYIENENINEISTEHIVGLNNKQQSLPESMNRDSKQQRFVNIFFYIWIFGVVALLFYSIKTYKGLKSKVRFSVRVDKNVYKCDYIASPFILGILKPRIYYPSNLGEEEKIYVLKHEKSHLLRKDYITKILAFIILIIYWFQPFCWIAYIIFCKDIEYACDEKACLDESRQWKVNYCQTLLNRSTNGNIIAVCPVSFGETSVKGRVKRIMKNKKTTSLFIIIAIIIFAMTGICFAITREINAKDVNKGVKEKEISNNQVEYKEVDYENIRQVMFATIAYCDDKILVFKDYFGLFVYSFDENRIVSSLDVKYIDCDMNQGDNCCTFNSYNNGEIIELNNQERKYWFDWRKNKLYSTYDLEEKTLDNRDNISENTNWKSYYSDYKVKVSKGILRMEAEEGDYKTVRYVIENNEEIVESGNIFIGK